LLPTLQPHHALFPLAHGPIQRLPQPGRDLVIFLQNLIDLWAWRDPADRASRLGIAPARYPGHLSRLERLVIQHQVSGKPTHDARLVAPMLVHGVAAILTFDKPGFSRYPGSRLCTLPT
jgi:predicted nucleic acid-binding protein